MEKNGALRVGITPCHVCGRNSETNSQKTGKPVCMSCYLKELPGPRPVDCMQKNAAEGFVGVSHDDGVEQLTTKHRRSR